jgi:hypothetical protein
MVELGPMRSKADLYIAQALTSCQLSECHCQKLFPTGKIPDTSIPAITINKSIEVVVRNDLKQLSENGLPTVHRRSSCRMVRFYPRRTLFFSNRLNPFSIVTP